MDTVKATPFESLEALRAEHSRLLRTSKGTRGQTTTRSDDLAEEVITFIARVRATGTRLDFPADREAAQSVLDYWTATLFTLRNGMPAAQALPTIPGIKPGAVNFQLEDFATTTLDQAVHSADRWLAEQSEEDRILAHRVLLRLVRLRSDGETFDPTSTVRATLFEYAAPEDIKRVLDALATVGVIRVMPGDVDETDRVTLRSPDLLLGWPAFESWRTKRKLFRKRVEDWDHAGRGPVGDGLTDTEMEHVRSYHDRDLRERMYIEACREGHRRKQELLRGGVVLLGVLSLIVIPLAVISIIGWGKAETQSKLASAAKVEIEWQYRLVRTIQIVRTLAEIRYAERTSKSVEDRSVALNRWETLTNQLRAEERSKHEDERSFTRLSSDYAAARTSSGMAGQKFATTAALQAAHLLRNDLLSSNYPLAEEELKTIKKAAFQRVRLCVKGMLKTFEDKSVDDAEPFVREFWLNYWGDMGLVESLSVESAMVQFGDTLERIEGQLPTFAYQDQLKRYNRNIQERGKQAEQPNVFAFTFPRSPEADRANRWYRSYSRMLYRTEIEELNKSADTLDQVLKKEENEQVSPYAR